MNTILILKKPKLEQNPDVGEENGHPNDGEGGGGVESSNSNKQDDNIICSSREEQEEAIVALIEHRTKEVEHLRKRVLYYSSQLGQAEKRLHDSESQLARIRCLNNVSPSNKKVKVEIDQVSFTSPPPPQSKPKLLIPSVNHGISRAIDDIEILEKGNKRKFEEKQHKELIPLIRGSSSPNLISCKGSSHIWSQHKRKMRSLALCPVNDNLFVTSALDGVVNLWSLQAKGSGASLLNTTDCVSPKLRTWPEDIAWHPQGYSLFCAYHADGDSQISILNWNKTDERAQVTFLDDKPHVKGIINSISFLPLDRTCFVTGGSDHSVIIWTEREGGKSWKPEILHRNQHSSAVMGVTGMQQKQIVISTGADKRIVGFDLHAERTNFKLQIESKCMSVLPNPCDFNLFMVQTGTPERQLRLYDIRLKQTEIHEFGWKQESSESQSALINQAWSPDGFYITSGSADPVIHIFDIRYNAHKPSQSVKAHQKRVFKALWHFSLPLLISTSSDLNIGLQKIT